MSNKPQELFRLADMDRALMSWERKRLGLRLRRIVRSTEFVEVGSSAIEGVVGKQDIDFVVCAARKHFNLLRRKLDQHFERNLNQFFSNSFQSYVVPGRIEISIQLLCKQHDHEHFVAFKAMLQKSALLRFRYNCLKRRWDGRPMNSYRKSKREFIEEALRGGWRRRW
jgi:GrpB-like predicted nucleotidyltransferase (UPF0157 family)